VLRKLVPLSHDADEPTIQALTGGQDFSPQPSLNVFLDWLYGEYLHSDADRAERIENVNTGFRIYEWQFHWIAERLASLCALRQVGWFSAEGRASRVAPSTLDVLSAVFESLQLSVAANRCLQARP
jgi:hypothetical protein